MFILVAASPVLLLILLLFVVKWPVIKAAPLTFLYAAVLALSVWSLPLQALGSALAKGFLLSLDVMLIVFGAVLFLNYLRKAHYIRSMEENLKSLSPDRRVQAILLAWLFGSFIEGVSGFGAPAVIVAPLLVGLGFPAFTAVLVSLVANSTAVTFGAIGTPVRIGFAGLDAAGVAYHAALINLFAGLIVPLMILALVSKVESDKPWRAFKQLVPWAIFAGLAFLVPYFLFAIWGSEFPSILGGAVGLIIAIFSLRYRFLIPKEMEGASSVDFRSLAKSFSPYFLLIGLLIIGKLIFSSLQIRWDLGSGLTHSLQFFHPGFGILTAAALLMFLNKRSVADFVDLGRETLSPLRKAAVSIFFISSLTYMMIVTGTGDSPRAGMLEMLASVVVSPALPFYSVFIGAFGSFLAGSATVSNLLFGELQARAAQDLGLVTSSILALQLIGAAVGNMIALANISAVQAAVKMEGQESALLYRLIGPCLTYLVVATTVGVLVSFLF